MERESGYGRESKSWLIFSQRATVVTINADETLGGGNLYRGRRQHAGGAYDGTPEQTPLAWEAPPIWVEPANKGQLMARRLAAKLPVTMFTIDLQTGRIFKLMEHSSTDWLNHLQFSSADPANLLMYCHEGQWEQVDRICDHPHPTAPGINWSISGRWRMKSPAMNGGALWTARRFSTNCTIRARDAEFVHLQPQRRDRPAGLAALYARYDLHP